MKYLRINPVAGKERYYYINGIIYRFRGEQLQFTLEKKVAKELGVSLSTVQRAMKLNPET